MDIKRLAAKINKTAHEKGWYEKGERNFHEVVALMHSELSEALEEWRAGHGITEVRIENGKPEGVPIELADAYIRIIDTCHELELPIETLGGSVSDKSIPFSVDIANLHWGLSQALDDLDLDVTKPEPKSWQLGAVAAEIERVCENWGIDLEAAVLQKMAYNESRPYRHGGKKA